MAHQFLLDVIQCSFHIVCWHAENEPTRWRFLAPPENPKYINGIVQGFPSLQYMMLVWPPLSVKNRKRKLSRLEFSELQSMTSPLSETNVMCPYFLAMQNFWSPFLQFYHSSLPSLEKRNWKRDLNETSKSMGKSNKHAPKRQTYPTIAKH